MADKQRWQSANATDIGKYSGIPTNLFNIAYNEIYNVNTKMNGLYGGRVLEDLGRIISYYNIYENGVKFWGDIDTDVDYIPSDLRYTRTAQLIDKEARFMFGKPAEITVNAVEEDVDNGTTQKSISNMQDLLDKVFERSKFPSQCLKGFKDCCIGERVALIVDFTEEGGIVPSFAPSYSFVFRKNAFGQLDRLIVFYTLEESDIAENQRIYRKKWWIAEDGMCHIKVDIFNGKGLVVEDYVDDELITDEITTLFNFIPAWIIFNDGLTGDEDGVSEVKALGEYEYWYSKLANEDIDSAQQNMNPIRYAIDMTPESTDRSNLSIKPGSFWDMQSSRDLADAASGKLGLLESAMSYSEPLSKTLDRISTSMNDAVDVPNINADSMSGVITSGKTLKAIYWPLTVRCDEKMLDWQPALVFMAKTIITGAQLYTDIAKLYVPEGIDNIDYEITVDNPYSLPEDELEEKQQDLAEVSAGTMSRKRYIKKWGGMTENEAQRELEQIRFEQEFFDNGVSSSMFTGQTLSAVTTNAQTSTADLAANLRTQLQQTLSQNSATANQSTNNQQTTPIDEGAATVQNG